MSVCVLKNPMELLGIGVACVLRVVGLVLALALARSARTAASDFTPPLVSRLLSIAYSEEKI